MTSEPEFVASIAQAVRGDESAFAVVVAPHERSLFRHCYRMLGSGPDAEDALQDTLIRAWRRLDTYDAAGTFGGWLYRIATNICLDLLRSRQGRLDPVTLGPPSDPREMHGAPDAESQWVEPIASSRLCSSLDPQDEIVGREDISLAFVSALQQLTPRQRACLLLHDVLGFTQAEVADVLDMTGSSVNSLLFRAREVTHPHRDGQEVEISDPRMRELLDRYVRAWRLADISAFVEVVADDVRFSMPPLREWFDGRPAVAAFTENAIFAAARPYGVTLRSGSCNGQPAFAILAPDPDGHMVASGLQIIDVRERDGQPLVTAIVSYRDPDLATRCGFPRETA